MRVLVARTASAIRAAAGSCSGHAEQDPNTPATSLHDLAAALDRGTRTHRHENSPPTVASRSSPRSDHPPDHHGRDFYCGTFSNLTVAPATTPACLQLRPFFSADVLLSSITSMQFRLGSLAVVILALFSINATCNEDANPITPASCFSVPVRGGQQVCQTDVECQDGIVCNGREACDRGAPGAAGCGCVRAAAPLCPATETCNEDISRGAARCEPAGCHDMSDVDGDGHASIACRGDDCDDNDANRFPGRQEVCDAANHDEDCDGFTFGVRDMDQDGYSDGSCCNTDTSGTHCGLDCDDTLAGITPGTFKCDALKPNQYEMCTLGAFVVGFCPGSETCHPQPNGTGFCF